MLWRTKKWLKQYTLEDFTGSSKITNTSENSRIQSLDAHIGIERNDDEPYDIPMPSRPMRRDKAKRKLKGVEGSSSKEKREGLMELNEHIQRMLQLAKQK